MLRDGLIVVAAGLVALVLLHAWVHTRFGPTPDELAAAKRARHAEPSPVAIHAVRRYNQLPAGARRKLDAYLHSSLVPMSTWVEQLRGRTFQVLCMGEDHESSTRDFLAREFFAEVRIDVLLLEATVDGLARMDEAVRAGDARVPLLEVDIAAILRASRTRNPGIEVVGIEETERQRTARRGQGRAGFREDSITSNFRAAFRPGRRHVVLFGGLHCASQPNWLFDRIQRRATPPMTGEMLNVRVFGQYQSQLVADFVHFLDRIGFPHGHFVIADARDLHPLLVEWFWLLAPIMRRYRAVIVFRE